MKRFVFGLVFLVALGASNLEAQAPIPLAQYHAKMLCSCIFVMEQAEDFCSSYVFLGLPIQEQNIDYNEEVVLAKAFGAEARATYEGEQTGCRLED